MDRLTLGRAPALRVTHGLSDLGGDMGWIVVLVIIAVVVFWRSAPTTVWSAFATVPQRFRADRRAVEARYDLIRTSSRPPRPT